MANWGRGCHFSVQLGHRSFVRVGVEVYRYSNGRESRMALGQPQEGAQVDISVEVAAELTEKSSSPRIRFCSFMHPMDVENYKIENWEPRLLTNPRH
jgi:hypothetical protein